MGSIAPLLVGAAAVAVVGARGWRRRVAAEPASAGRARAAALRGVTGLVVVLLALATPLDGLAHASFAWHMAQHQLLLLVAAPLLASAAPVTTLRYAVGAPAGRTGRATGVPAGVGVVLAGVLAIATLFAWHVPGAYDAALTSVRVHQLEHASLLASATLLWGAVLTAARDDRVLVAVIVLAAAAITGAALGVVLLTSSTPLYAHPAAGGVGPLDQQRLGGAMMKVGALVAYAGAAVWLFVRWLGRLEAEDLPLARVEPSAPVTRER